VLAVPTVALLRVLYDFFRIRLRVEESPSRREPTHGRRDDGRPAAEPTPSSPPAVQASVG
jgi:hypothetical protein